MRALVPLAVAALLMLGGCTATSQRGTLATLAQMEPDLREVTVQDGLERAAQSYRRYLAETEESPLTPDAMRRLADLQVEQAYGVFVHGQPKEMAKPQAAAKPAQMQSSQVALAATSTESNDEFEARATAREDLLAGEVEYDAVLPADGGVAAPSGPREAIAIYREILERYPGYERNDQVLYQMSRAFDELGMPDDAMTVMNDLVARYPHSRYVDEVHFRRGEYSFVRRHFLDAEDAYREIVRMGAGSSYFELALYKLGWTLYKQELYDQALESFIAMLDYRMAQGFDFHRAVEEDEEHRVEDTFRVVSLSFSNLGGAEVLDDYFSRHGERSYSDRIYSNLAEFYFDKLRYDDAASIYKAFIARSPFHLQSPRFAMRIIEIYDAGAFPRLVVEAKKEFALRYAKDAEYWQHFSIEDAPDVIGFLKTNLTDLANHYHALYQERALAEARPANFAEAQHWYREFLSSFPADEESPGVNYQLADLLFENRDYLEAAHEYERTAYGYDAHERASDAGYAAVYAYRQELAAIAESRRLEVVEATVASSLRFAETFPEHGEAAAVLGAAADDLYTMQRFAPAREAARELVNRYPESEGPLRRNAWAVIAHSSIDLAEFAVAEAAYVQLLTLIPEDDKERPQVVDSLAASIYKQAETATAAHEYEAAANHFLRISEAAPTSEIRKGAHYDGAAMLVQMGAWSRAATVLEEFRSLYPDHELVREVTKQLAHVYREDGAIERSAGEHERVAREAEDPELSRAALLTAGELYDQAENLPEAVRVFEQYVRTWPRPLDVAMETRFRLAEIARAQEDDARYYAKLRELVKVDREAGSARTDRSRFLGATAALGLAEITFERFASLELKQPFEKSLAEKQKRMDKALETFEALVEYEVAQVTAGATYYIAEIYFEFSASLMGSERPDGLTGPEMNEYELMIEEEAYPFEEQAIGVHERNFELLTTGVFNPWVQKSLDRLAVIMPGRYAKSELSGGPFASVDRYAYRKPGAAGEATDAVAAVVHGSAGERIGAMARARLPEESSPWEGGEP